MKMKIKEISERSLERKVFDEVKKLIVRLYEKLYMKP